MIHTTIYPSNNPQLTLDVLSVDDGQAPEYTIEMSICTMHTQYMPILTVYINCISNAPVNWQNIGSNIGKILADYQ